MRISGSWTTRPTRPTRPAVLDGTLMVLLVLVVLLVVAAVVGAASRVCAPTASAGSTPGAPAASAAPAARPVPGARAVRSLAVLRDWDRERARAWATGDVGALRRLYLPGSGAGDRDAAMLRAWRDRRLRVADLLVQVLAVDLRLHTARRIVLVVTDRLASATAVRDGRRRDLPRDRATTRRLELRRVGERWMMASVQEAPGRAPPSPAASTERTSGSAKS